MTTQRHRPRPQSIPARSGLLPLAVLCLTLTAAFGAHAEPQPSIAIHGTAKYQTGEAFAYVNPDAPKGGRVSIGVQGSYNSLNPLTYQGNAPDAVRDYVYQSLMARSGDEAFSLYGLIAESIDVAPDRSAATFVIRPEARFSDGHPITADDVAFSLTLLTEHGWPFMRKSYGRVSRLVTLDARRVRFEFNAGGDRELPLLVGLMPILPRHAVDPATFEQTSLVAPIGSGPYVVSRIDAGRELVLTRSPDWWARDLPIMRGRYNFDELRYEYFRSASSLFEAFKAGEIDVLVEDDSNRWARGYDFPAVRDGRIVKREFDLKNPAGMTGLVFNTRKPLFADIRVRRALSLVFDAEWLNSALYGNLYKRTQSFFERSDLSSAGIAEDAEEQRLLAPFPNAVSPAIADGSYTLPKSDGTGANRTNERAALELLRQAGYDLRGRQLVDAKTGAAFTFEVLIDNQRQGRLLLQFARQLAQVGITMTIREVDDTQYETRLKSNDFDMIQAFWSASLSPGDEQSNRWGSAAATASGTRNYAGVSVPAADAMITAMTRAETEPQFRSAVRAFDRVLRSGDYVIPLFHAPKLWVAYWTRLVPPEVPPYAGFELETWWSATAAPARAPVAH